MMFLDMWKNQRTRKSVMQTILLHLHLLPHPLSQPPFRITLLLSMYQPIWRRVGFKLMNLAIPWTVWRFPTSEEVIVVEKEVVSTQNDVHPVSETVASSVQEDAPKKSYASVVHALNLKTQPFQRVSGVKPVKQSVTAVPPVASQQTGSPRPPGNNAVEINNKSAAVEGHSIFVANLPMDATVDELVQTFSKFGAIKPNGVQVRSYKQDKNCFGFVEFESADSVEKALEVSTVSIGTRTAHIEKKNAKTDGEKYPVRKGGFRNDSFRNRGNFGGGRGNGRNDFESQGGVSGQAWGTTGRNGEANKKVYQNGGGRGPRQAQAGRN
ncbi:RAS GTPASE-ACTIVATING PROTEIN-BINDING PROTEIN [Salix purpurea]|uniref:RAS GTPASE-ACTIVATING PROTEIN-BINDING PROTEIN n=1 Tax=Salix purpurea TaxID=77065 RepID=A0A9Q0UAW0_SALPP|nr:RAS GTPASE-ACTIVATING PROTEIN-BINDING PROTEIN [Salix purpurea]